MPSNFFAITEEKRPKCAIGNEIIRLWFYFFTFTDLTSPPSHRVAMTEWRYATNSTDFNKRRMKEQQSVSAKFECISWNRATRFNYQLFGDQNLQRQFQRIARQGRCGLGDEKYNEVSGVLTAEKLRFRREGSNQENYPIKMSFIRLSSSR